MRQHPQLHLLALQARLQELALQARLQELSLRARLQELTLQGTGVGAKHGGPAPTARVGRAAMATKVELTATGGNSTTWQNARAEKKRFWMRTLAQT